MRKLHQVSLAALAAASLGFAAAPAAADVFIYVDVFKDKDIFVFESTFKSKFVNVLVEQSADPDSSAQAKAIVNVRNEGNFVDGFPGGPPSDDGLEKDALIANSINANTGVIGVNQDAGNMSNQGNVVSLAALVTGPGADPSSAVTYSQAVADQRNIANQSYQDEALNLNDPDRTATIANSVNNNAGLIGVNQNTGNMNNQTNAVALAVGLGAVVALSEAALGQENAGNVMEDISTLRTNLIVDSASGNSGVTQINQSSGNMNNQGSVLSFSALTSTASIGVPGT
jgi:hypothetical protein